ncbi:hypothetical protein C1646_674731 [Rhizophagus diaphanus]|nr:hypothetical protein C1646_674731 [Rhizophagus diaphanus] [Rhizophagus sp. MUCL 43196]
MLFDTVSNQIILDCMCFLEKSNVRNKYERISKVLPQYNSRQIRHHYKNVLNVRLNKDGLSNDEKDFIVQWIEQHQGPNGTIHWKVLILVMELRFDKLHSENKLKNFWYRRKLRLERDSGIRGSADPFSNPNPTNDTNIYNHFLPLPIEPKFQPIIHFKHPYKMYPFF